MLFSASRNASPAASPSAPPLVTLVAFAPRDRDRHRGIAGAIPALIAIAALYAIGDSVRVRRESRAKESERAVAEERARIARELHDVVAHNVSVMVVQAAAGDDVFDSQPERRAPRSPPSRRPAAARSASSGACSASSRGDESADYDPQPGLDRLDMLVASVRATGLGVELPSRAPARAAACTRALGLPDRPGGADEHAQARARHHATRPRPLRRRRARGRGRRRRRRRALTGDGGRGLHRDARARRALRRRARRGRAARAAASPSRARCRSEPARDPRPHRRRPGARPRAASA